MSRRTLRALWAGGLAPILLLSCGAAPPEENTRVEQRSHRGSYRWISPLIDCEQAAGGREVRSIRLPVEKHIKEQLAPGRVTHISVYYRDLRNGPWFGVNEKKEFLPASLLKVPLMMALLKEDELIPGSLSVSVPIPRGETVALTQQFSPVSPLKPGGSVPAAELMTKMVRQSDNLAMEALARHFGTEGIRDIYDDLGVLTPTDGVPDRLRVKDYASIFRLLYNVSYLSRASSERALDELTRSEFRQGLTAPLPKNIPVAHKYGERETKTGEKQLHDCGIVYFPAHPYILCVMTRGEDWPGLAHAIQSISGAVYGAIAAQFPPP